MDYNNANRFSLGYLGKDETEKDLNGILKYLQENYDEFKVFYRAL